MHAPVPRCAPRWTRADFSGVPRKTSHAPVHRERVRRGESVCLLQSRGTAQNDVGALVPAFAVLTSLKLEIARLVCARCRGPA